MEELGENVEDDWKEMEARITGIEEERGNRDNAGRGWWDGKCIVKRREVRKKLREW